MKRIIALLLLTSMLVLSLASCSVNLEDKGAIIPMYLTTPQTNLDPTRVIYDKNFVKYSGLLFEGLTNVTAKGKIEKGLATDWYTKYDEERGEYFLYINLANTQWNDGRVFTASHVVYAWKQILSPETNSPAAALLYDVKNAREIKAGNMTVDDLGVAAVDSYLLEVQFEKPIDAELFLEAVSSPALVPLRDDAVTGKEDSWATSPDDIATIGQFVIRSMNPKGSFRVEFSKYYKLDKELKKGYNEFVKPYMLVTDYSMDVNAAVEALNNGQIYYVGELTKDLYAANEKKIETSASLSNYTYYFDCTNSTLSNPKVRKALSTALDREEIASIIGLGTKAATGFVGEAAFGSSMGKSYRKEAGNLYNTSADTAAAQALLNEAGVKGGSFTITYRTDREYDVLVAEYAKSVWESLGFSVSLKGLDLQAYEEAVMNGGFDVLALDYQGLSTSAYSFLAPFAPAFSGNVVSVDVDSTGITPHVTGFNSEEYSALIASVLEELTRSKRVDILIEAEKMLCEQCPAISLVSYQNYYLASSELKGLGTSPYGYTVFTDATLKKYAEKNAAYEAAQEAAKAE